MKIDIDALIAEAVKHMEDEGDVRWSIGMALQELYGDKGWDKVQDRLVNLYIEEAKANTYS
jgi:lysylphosphatidylglycerol synthetase-like protein (DUF2156 family)